MFFWWGYHFDTWGQRFSFDPQFLGFVMWFPAAAFGVGYAAGGARSGLKYGGGVLGLFVAALVVGMLSGSYT